MELVGKRAFAFSLVEVVLAVGVVAFAVVAILGVFPIGLQSGHSAQDDTRATQIAQTVLNALASQAQTNFSAVTIPLANNNKSNAIDLSSSSASPALQLYADNSGQLSATKAGASYSVGVSTNNAPPGFDSGYANLTTVKVAWPAAAVAADQSSRSYMRILSKY